MQIARIIISYHERKCDRSILITVNVVISLIIVPFM